MNQVTELHAWIGIEPNGNEWLLALDVLMLVAPERSRAEALRPAAEVALHESKRSEHPLARIELRTFRRTPNG